jgi:phage-related protein
MMRKCKRNLKRIWKKNKVLAASCLLLLVINGTGYAQDGVAGINEANQKVRSYFDAGTELMYAVGAILGLIGAVKVYQKWNAGDPDTGKVAAAWFGSCVFLVVVATVIKSFFGV